MRKSKFIFLNEIRVHDRVGQNFKTDVSVHEKFINISFAQPIFPINTIDIDLNRVKIFGASNIFSYRITAKLIGLEQKLDLGVAQIRSNK